MIFRFFIAIPRGHVPRINHKPQIELNSSYKYIENIYASNYWMLPVLPPPHMKPQITTNCHKRNLLSRRKKKYSKATFSLLPVRNLLISVFPLLATAKGPKQETLSRNNKSPLDSISSKLLKLPSLLRASQCLPKCRGARDSPCASLSSIDPFLTRDSKAARNRTE